MTQPHPEPEPEEKDILLTAHQVAVMLQVEENTLYRWRRDRTNLPFYTLGDNTDRPAVRYRKSDVLDYLGERRVEPDPQTE